MCVEGRSGELSTKACCEGITVCFKKVTPVLLIVVVKHWNKILCNMHNQMLE